MLTPISIRLYHYWIQSIWLHTEFHSPCFHKLSPHFPLFEHTITSYDNYKNMIDSGHIGFPYSCFKRSWSYTQSPAFLAAICSHWQNWNHLFDCHFCKASAPFPEYIRLVTKLANKIILFLNFITCLTISCRCYNWCINRSRFNLIPIHLRKENMLSKVCFSIRCISHLWIQS